MAKEVVIIGGGIIGLCTAYFLQKEGHKVTVIDKSDMSTGASFVNAGYLTPSHFVPLASPGMISTGLRYMFDAVSPVYLRPRLNLDFIEWAWYFKRSATKTKVEMAMPLIKNINLLSRELFEAILSSEDLGTFQLERKGLLMIYQTEKEGAKERLVAKRAKEMGLPVEHLKLSEINKLEPDVNIKALGAFHYLCDAHTTPEQFMKKLLNYLTVQGIDIRNSEEVLDFVISEDRITKIITNKSEYQADEVVFAAGSWTGLLMRKLGIKLPLEAGKGYRIDVQQPTGITMPAILVERKIAVTPMQGFTRIAGTMELSGINHQINNKRVAAIADGVSGYYSGLKISKTDISMARSGLRPISPDGLPYIGRSKVFSNLIIATGHAMMGWSLGPATGKIVGELVSDRQLSIPIEAFNPQRKF